MSAEELRREIKSLAVRILGIVSRARAREKKGKRRVEREEGLP